MLIVGIAVIWLIVVLFIVALCRGAAAADGRGLVSADDYPASSVARAGTAGTGVERGAVGAAAAAVEIELAGLVMLEDRPRDLPAPAVQDLRARARGARGRAGQYAAGS